MTWGMWFTALCRILWPATVTITLLISLLVEVAWLIARIDDYILLKCPSQRRVAAATTSR